MVSAVLFDMDGLLCDFVRGSLAWHKKELPILDVRWDFQKQVGMDRNEEFWGPLENHEFWANLDPHPDGMALFAEAEKLIGIDRLGILSGDAVKHSREGKRQWLAKHLPKYERRGLFGPTKELAAAPCKILLDDYDRNCDEFRKFGGRAILVPRPWNSRCCDIDKNGEFDVAQLTAELAEMLAAT
jgi:hypothetical protein